MKQPAHPTAAPATAHELLADPDPQAACRARLLEGDLRGRDLTGRDLHGVDLNGRDLTGVDFSGSDLSGADLGKARLDDARFVEARLEGANLRGATGERVVLTRARLRGADLARSRLPLVQLFGAYVHHANFDRAVLRGGAMAGMRGYDSATWKNVDIREVDTHGTHLARRVIDDQNYIHEFRSRSRRNELIYWIWWATSDCGRSVGRWALLTLLLVVTFSFAFTCVSIDYGAHETWFSPFYYSVVTMTSLGYGDVVPRTPWGQAVAMLEVTVGYVMLGGLMSIFSTKMARRAD